MREAKEIRENIRSEMLSDAISKRYLSYAMSTIVARSLPDVRDGLKPVHRRLLYAMRQLKLDPKGGYKKCARVVGDVMGKYHPHGDASIYDAMVRLAQGFSVRYPLVDGQGNFGNIDGDSAAAMRYTEAKMTSAGTLIMEGLDEDAVDFMDTYTGEDSEPVVMPSLFPNLLANGANGIAVGMATNIPPHNILELCDGIVALIRKPDMTPAELCAHIPAPDFPTGGTIAQSRESLNDAYASGRGSFMVRARWVREDLPYANYQIAITEIPYQVQKSRVIERIAELMESNKLPLVADVRDESTDSVRIVIEPKSRTTDPKVIMAQLFQLTELASRFALNLNVLDSRGVPRVMGLKEALREYIDHRVVVLARRSNFRIGNIKKRLEILGGLLVAYKNLDAVIRIIRDKDEPKPVLMERFRLTDPQAEAILNMRLRNLRKLEEAGIRAEDKALREELAALETLLSSEKNKLARVAAEVKEMRAAFAKTPALASRRTLLDHAAADEPELAPEAFIQKEPITILLSQMGWLKSLKGHSDLAADFSFKEGDTLAFALHAHTTDKIIFVASNGQSFSLDASKVASGRGYGDAIRLVLDIPADADILDMFIHAGVAKLLLATAKGYGFVADASNLLATTRKGKQIVNLSEGDTLAAAREVAASDDMAAVIGTNRKLLVFPLSEIPEMSRGRGVVLQKYKEPKAALSDVSTFARKSGLSWESGAKTYTLGDISMWRGKRADVGHMPPAGFPRSNKFGG